MYKDINSSYVHLNCELSSIVAFAIWGYKMLQIKIIYNKSTYTKSLETANSHHYKNYDREQIQYCYAVQTG